MTRAAIYCRVSTDRQEREGTSLESQLERCLQFASEKGWSVRPIHIFSEAVSGTTWRDRPRLQAMLAAARRGEIDVVIVYAFDRLSRKQVHTAVILDRLDESHVLYESVTEEFDATPVGQFIRSAKAFAAEIENESRVERSVRGKYTRISRGKIHGHSAELYGYRRDKERGVRVIYEPEARTVRLIFEWVALEGLSVRGVIRRLNDEGIPAPSESGNKRQYKDGRTCRWGNGSVYRILADPAYKGETILWRHKSRGPHRAYMTRHESEWVRLDGVTPEIVSPELWQAAQERRKVNTGAAVRNQTRPYLLRGLIFCGHEGCGLPMRSNPEHSGRTYRCSSREKPSGACGGRRVPADVVEEQLWAEVVTTMRDSSRIAAEVERVRASGEPAELETERDGALRRVAKLQQKQDRLSAKLADADDLMWGLIEQQIREAERQKQHELALATELEQKIANHQAAVAKVEGMHAYCANVAANLEALSFTEKRDLLEALDIRVIANGRDWSARGGIPTDSDGCVVYQASS